MGGVHFEDCPNFKPWMKCQYVPYAFDHNNTSEIVIFRGFHITEKDPLPTHRPSYQKWVYIETEAPFRTWNHYRKSLDIWDKFNVTVTYQPDATVRFSRFDFQCAPKDPADYQSLGVNFAANKTRGVPAMWMVSNCHGTSGRESYVSELQNYVKVDIYGACSEKGRPCPPYPHGVECINDIMAQYKFYLAFENSFCSEYITEKILKTLDVNVIPIVMGLADYETRLTPGTYLDVRDFTSPKDLADLIKTIDANDTLYNGYIQRKFKLRCDRITPKNTYHCDLCRHLYYHRHEREIAPDIQEYFGTRQKCVSPREFFTGHADAIISKIKQADFSEDI